MNDALLNFLLGEIKLGHELRFKPFTVPWSGQPGMHVRIYAEVDDLNEVQIDRVFSIPNIEQANLDLVTMSLKECSARLEEIRRSRKDEIQAVD